MIHSLGTYQLQHLLFWHIITVPLLVERMSILPSLGGFFFCILLLHTSPAPDCIQVCMDNMSSYICKCDLQFSKLILLRLIYPGMMKVLLSCFWQPVWFFFFSLVHGVIIRYLISRNIWLVAWSVSFFPPWRTVHVRPVKLK